MRAVKGLFSERERRHRLDIIILKVRFAASTYDSPLRYLNCTNLYCSFVRRC